MTLCNLQIVERIWRSLLTGLCLSVLTTPQGMAQHSETALSTTPVTSMSITEAEQELATITDFYNRKGHQIKQTALGTLLRFYPQRIVPCGTNVTSVSDCLNTQWPDLKAYPGHFLGPDEKRPLKPTIEQARMTEDNYLDALDRVNMLLRAVRHPETLSADNRYRDQLEAVIRHLTRMREADYHNRLLYEKIFTIGGIFLLLLAIAVSVMLVRKHIAQRDEETSQLGEK